MYTAPMPSRRHNLVIALIIILLIASLCLIGVAASPRIDGHPLLLSPELARETRYFDFVSSQIEALQHSQDYLAEAFAADTATDNLLETIRQARIATETALDVLRDSEDDTNAAPPELASLGEMLQQTAAQYVDAGRLVVQFINEPTPDTQKVASDALTQALLSLQETRQRWNRLVPH